MEVERQICLQEDQNCDVREQANLAVWEPNLLNEPLIYCDKIVTRQWRKGAET